MKSPSTHEVSVRPAVLEDAAAIAADLREADRLELEASTPKKPEAAILEAIRLSVVCWTAECDGVPIAVFGVSPVSMIRGTGSPWLLGTTGCDAVTVPFVRLARQYIPAMLSLFPELENMVDVRNVKSIRWLKRLGFGFGDATPHPYSGSPFFPFSMRSGNV
jgi:hypothetical protein